MIFCTNCGSQNHATSDCSKPKPAVPFTPPAPQAARSDPRPLPPPPVAKNPTYTPPCATAEVYCTATRLPSFKTEKAAKAYESDYCPEIGLGLAACPDCSGFHLVHKPAEVIKNETGWRQPKAPFLRASTVKDIASRQREAEDRLTKSKEPKPERRVALPKRKPDTAPSLFN